jgi:maltooligosyltrehalose trehalohydrolase
MRIGAHLLQTGACEFCVWAPFQSRVTLVLESPEKRKLPMEQDRDGYWRSVVPDCKPGTPYWYLLGNEQFRPDPASFHQPNGVHNPSAVVDHAAYQWHDSGWRNIDRSSLILYELHVGTFTTAGTFNAVAERLDDLLELGVNAIELMPVAQFPGERNWGYDGVYPFAVQHSYGGVSGLKRLIDQSHQHGIAVFLDVVYNHLGPEGNYLAEFGPYFTDKYRTPWGRAINYDGPHSDHVRNYFIENALSWIRNFHIDGLRLDAVHAIFDNSATPFLQELAERIRATEKETGRCCHVVAESNLNDVKIIKPTAEGGFGHDAQWSDDFHHSLHTLLTGERDGYYEDFGSLHHLVKSLREGFAYSGEYSAFRKRRHGNSSLHRPAAQFVISSQNHDQIGNRLRGDRLSSLVSFEALKLAASLELLSPYIPLLFMGEEYAETNPFLFFVSHSDQQLIEAVRKGRKEEFESFGWKEEPPDPQSPETFFRSRLSWEQRTSGTHKIMLEYYRNLISLRREQVALTDCSKDHMRVEEIDQSGVVVMQRWCDQQNIFALFNSTKSQAEIHVPFAPGTWKKLLDSADSQWGGPGSGVVERIVTNEAIRIQPYQAILFVKE